jgi:hypothetical protein
MSKWYVKSNTVEKIVSIPHGTSLDAAVAVYRDSNKFDTFDEYFYVDQRGMRDYTTADNKTKVIKTVKVVGQSVRREKKGL